MSTHLIKSSLDIAASQLLSWLRQKRTRSIGKPFFTQKFSQVLSRSVWGWTVYETTCPLLPLDTELANYVPLRQSSSAYTYKSSSMNLLRCRVVQCRVQIKPANGHKTKPYPHQSILIRETNIIHTTPNHHYHKPIQSKHFSSWCNKLLAKLWLQPNKNSFPPKKIIV